MSNLFVKCTQCGSPIFHKGSKCGTCLERNERAQLLVCLRELREEAEHAYDVLRPNPWPRRTWSDGWSRLRAAINAAKKWETAK